MWPFKYPYTNFHELNLDWILETVQKVESETNGIYDYIDNAIANIDINQATVDMITKYGTVYTNANSLGVKANDPSSAKANSDIINDALKTGHYLYFPTGAYYVSETLVIVNGSGIIGENMFSSRLISSANVGVEIRLDYDKTKADNTTICRFSDIGLIGQNYPTTGLYINNYFFTVTCGGNHNLYAQLKGNSYALELRNSPIENLYISSFDKCVDSTFYLAVMTFRNMFIYDATSIGFNNLTSDSMFNDIAITYCAVGLRTCTESNKFNNVKIYMNGRDSAASTNNPGVLIENEKHSSFSNFEVQENFKGGVYMKNSQYILMDCIVDANCFHTSTGVGFEMIDCNYITGSIIALNKNSAKTQQHGIFITNCTNININYSENEQLVPISDNLKMLLNTSSETIVHTVTQPVRWYNATLRERNNVIYFSGMLSPAEIVEANTKLLGFDKNFPMSLELIIPAEADNIVLRSDGLYSRYQMAAKDYAVMFAIPLTT